MRFKGERLMSETRADASTPTFFDLYSQGKALPEDINDFIDRWHDEVRTRDVPLHDYLGLSRDEYEVWLYDPLCLPQILEARTSGRRLVEIMAERFETMRRINNPAHKTILFSLGNWLNARPKD